MRCVFKAPASPAEIREIVGTLRELQELVGGYLELAPVFGVSVYCNEEGAIKDLAPNVLLEHVGLVLGPVVVLGPVDADGNETPLDALQAEHWRDLLDGSAVR